jgi:N-acetylmuramoyl-L-alanine amidase
LQKYIRKSTSSLVAIMMAASMIPATAFAETEVIQAEKLKEAFLKADHPEIEMQEKVSLPASSLVEAVNLGKSLISFKGLQGSFTLPINQWDIEGTARQLGIALEDMHVHVQMNPTSAEISDAIASKAKAINSSLSTDAVEFQLQVGSEATESVQLLFRDIYAPHALTVKKELDSTKASAVMYDPDSKSLSFVPALFEKDSNGHTVVNIKHTGNKIYSVIESNKTFDDINDHWAKNSIELMANKLIVDGATETSFEADRNITRAEFAAIAVRALGLGDIVSTETFSDVASDAWYADAVSVATAAGLINGFEDGTFRPDELISREQLAAIAVRATYYAGIATELSEPNIILDQYKDADQIVWAQAELAAAINARLIQGSAEQTINPTANATRAEAVTVLRRILMLAEFID